MDEEEADEAEETVNFDDEEGAHDDAQEDEGADMDEENEDEATMEVEDDGSDKQEL